MSHTVNAETDIATMHCFLDNLDNLVEFTYSFAGGGDIYDSLTPDNFLGTLEFYSLINKIQGPNSAHGRFFMGTGESRMIFTLVKA